MLQQANYVIWAGAELKKHTSDLPEDLRMLLTLPRIWTKNEGGRSVWTAQDHAAAIKLTFMARIHSHQNEFPEIGKLLGHPPIALHVFDRWWSLERVGTVPQWEKLAGELKAQELRCFQLTGMGPVDDWTRNILE